VIFLPAATGNLVQGNLIGTDATGTTALGNTLDGVLIEDAGGNTIGGASVAARNVISANGDDGVNILGDDAVGNVVAGNYIGTDSTGTTALGNGVSVPTGDGVALGRGASETTVGGLFPASRNLITANADAGVFVYRDAGAGNAIVRNSILANGGLGIALGEKTVFVNDPGDPDTGPNTYQNYPVLTSITVGATHTTVDGYLNSLPNTTYRLEFYANTSCDASLHGEGESFLGVLNVTTDGTGNTLFSGTFPNTVPVTDQITATATDPNDNTSELSCCGVDTDSDSDTISDLDDCDDADPLVWTVPGEVVGVMLSHSGGVGGTTTLDWPAPTPFGGHPSVVVYDVIRSSNPADFGVSAVCMETDDGPNTTATHGTDPAPGAVVYFLIRAEDPCGMGSIGDSARTARTCT